MFRSLEGARMQEQSFKPPAHGSFQPGGPHLNAPAPSTFHIHIIIPRRDLLSLIGFCCPKHPAQGGPLKPLFTTAAAQLYAEAVVDGLCALCQAWLTGPNERDKRRCQRAGVHSAEQLRSFFDCPVISMMYQHLLGPDDDTVLLPGLQDRPTKSLGKVQCRPSSSSLHGVCVTVSLA
jgi:hypothetical protein